MESVPRASVDISTENPTRPAGGSTRFTLTLNKKYVVYGVGLVGVVAIVALGALGVASVSQGSDRYGPPTRPPARPPACLPACLLACLPLSR